MKHACNLLLVLVVILPSALYSNRFDSLQLKKINISWNFESGSRGIVSAIQNKFIFGGYISREKAENAETKIWKNNSGGAQNNYNVTAVLNNTKKNSKIESLVLGISQNTIAGYTLNGDAYRLAILGNADYAGKNLDISNIKFTQITMRNFYIQHQFKTNINTKSLQMQSATVAISQLVNYFSGKTNNSNFFTEQNGDSINAKLNGELITKRSKNIFGAGIGLNFGFTVAKNFTNKLLQFGVNQLGFLYSSNNKKYYRDNTTGVSINQVEINRYQLGNSEWWKTRYDSLYNRIGPKETSINKAFITPFSTFVQMDWKQKQYRAILSYTYITGYLPQLLVNRKMDFKKGLSIVPEITLGGWDTYNLNVKSIWENKSKKHKVVVKISGIEAWILPNLTHGNGLSLHYGWML